MDDALKRATPAKQQENKEIIREVNRHVDLKSMTDVEEPSAPSAASQTCTPADPIGASHTRLNNNIRERIESIQEHNRTPTNDVEVVKDLITPEVLPETPITTLEIMEVPSTVVTEIILIP